MGPYSLLSVFGNINDEFIDEVLEYKTRKRRITIINKIAAVTASAMSVIGMSLRFGQKSRHIRKYD